MVNMSEFLPNFAVFKTVQPGLCPSVLGLEVPQGSGEGAGTFGLEHLVFSSVNLEKSFPVSSFPLLIIINVVNYYKYLISADEYCFKQVQSLSFNVSLMGVAP